MFVMYALVVWVSTSWMGRVDMSQKILNPSPQVLKAWQLVAGRINVISNSNVYPSLLELLGFMHERTVDLLNFHAGEGMSILTFLIVSLCRQLAPF